MKPFAVRMGHAGVAVTRAIAACLVVLMSAHAFAQVSEYELKAAFLFNFALFTQPIGAASKAATGDGESARPYHICIFGKDPFGAAAKHCPRA